MKAHDYIIVVLNYATNQVKMWSKNILKSIWKTVVYCEDFKQRF